MLSRHQDTVRDVVRIADGCIVIAAWLVSYWARFFLGPFAVTKGLPPFDTYAALAPLIGVLWLSIFTWMRVYHSSRMRGRMHEFQALLKAHGVALLSLIAITYLFEDYRYSRLVMVYFATFGALGLMAFRLLLGTMLSRVRARGLNLRYTIAIGEGEAVDALIQRLEGFPELGIRLRGVVVHEQSTVQAVGGRPILGRFCDLPQVLRDARIDEVMIALPPSQQHEMDRILDLLKDEAVAVRLIPDVLRHVTLGCEVENFDGLPIVHLNGSPMIGWGAFAKRATDVLVASLALLLLAPVFLLVALLVKVSSPGPVLYAQERMGLDGRTFRMLKFRSMRVDAESSSGAVWAQRVDARRTKVGTLLRKTSLDELPQFWNVLRGDMSLVGPRPERPVFVEKFRSEIPMYMLRHKVKSGITGWAQINGWRGNTPLDGRIACDLFYIRNWSYALDLKILIMTLWKGFIDKNAY